MSGVYGSNVKSFLSTCLSLAGTVTKRALGDVLNVTLKPGTEVALNALGAGAAASAKVNDMQKTSADTARTIRQTLLPNATEFNALSDSIGRVLSMNPADLKQADVQDILNVIRTRELYLGKEDLKQWFSLSDADADKLERLRTTLEEPLAANPQGIVILPDPLKTLLGEVQGIAVQQKDRKDIAAHQVVMRLIERADRRVNSRVAISVQNAKDALDAILLLGRDSSSEARRAAITKMILAIGELTEDVPSFSLIDPSNQLTLNQCIIALDPFADNDSDVSDLTTIQESVRWAQRIVADLFILQQGLTQKTVRNLFEQVGQSAMPILNQAMRSVDQQVQSTINQTMRSVDQQVQTTVNQFQQAIPPTVDSFFQRVGQNAPLLIDQAMRTVDQRVNSTVHPYLKQVKSDLDAIVALQDTSTLAQRKDAAGRLRASLTRLMTDPSSLSQIPDAQIQPITNLLTSLTLNAAIDVFFTDLNAFKLQFAQAIPIINGAYATHHGLIEGASDVALSAIIEGGAKSARCTCALYEQCLVQTNGSLSGCHTQFSVYDHQRQSAEQWQTQSTSRPRYGRSHRSDATR